MLNTTTPQGVFPLHRFRCFTHALVTAVAVVSWGGVAWGIIDNPGVDNMMRLPWFALLSVAAVSGGLALLPVMLHGMDGRPARHAQTDERGLCEAFYWWGREDEQASAEGREPEHVDKLARLRLIVGD